MKNMNSTTLAVLQMLLQNDDARKISPLPRTQSNNRMKGNGKKKKNLSENNKLKFPDIGNENSAAA